MVLKKELRKRMIATRMTLSKEEVDKASKKIVQQLLVHPCYQDASVIYAYSSIKNEIKLDELFLYAFSEHKILALPKVHGERIDFFTIRHPGDLEIGAFGIYEPGSTCKKAPNPDLILVPGVAFSKDGFRLGYGGGFYDRFLSAHDAYSIGVGYGFQIIDELPVEHFDQKLSEIVTDR